MAVKWEGRRLHGTGGVKLRFGEPQRVSSVAYLHMLIMKAMIKMADAGIRQGCLALVMDSFIYIVLVTSR